MAENTAVEQALSPPCAADALEKILALEHAGEWGAAGGAYARLFDHAVQHRDVPLLVDSLRKQAHALQRRHGYGEAEELAELSQAIACLHGLVEAAARATTILANNAYFQQNWRRARQLYETAFHTAIDTGDDVQAAWTRQNLGVIANILGELGEARVLYLESICYAVRCETPSAAVVAYNNLGMVCADRKSWFEADVYFHRGIEIAEEAADLPAQARLYTNRAEPLICVGEFNRARATLKRGEALAEAVQDIETLADVARFRAMIARLLEDFAAADTFVNQALRMADEHRLPLERAEALEELAHLRNAQGCHDAAQAALRAARRGFRSLGAERDAARVEQWSLTWTAHPAAPTEELRTAR